jgi:hypothetical protein
MGFGLTINIVIVTIILKRNIQIWIHVLIPNSYKLFHHCFGTWTNFMEPPKGPIGIWE